MSNTPQPSGDEAEHHERRKAETQSGPEDGAGHRPLRCRGARGRKKDDCHRQKDERAVQSQASRRFEDIDGCAEKEVHPSLALEWGGYNKETGIPHVRTSLTVPCRDIYGKENQCHDSG